MAKGENAKEAASNDVMKNQLHCVYDGCQPILRHQFIPIFKSTLVQTGILCTFLIRYLCKGYLYYIFVVTLSNRTSTALQNYIEC